MANESDRTLVKWAVGTVIGSLGLVGAAKLGDAPKETRVPVEKVAENGVASDTSGKSCTMAGGKKGHIIASGLCGTTAPFAGSAPDSTDTTLG
jgi:hypothetical protein